VNHKSSGRLTLLINIVPLKYIFIRRGGLIITMHSETINTTSLLMLLLRVTLIPAALELRMAAQEKKGLQDAMG
jgi:hypothetical protein